MTELYKEVRNCLQIKLTDLRQNDPFNQASKKVLRLSYIVPFYHWCNGILWIMSCSSLYPYNISKGILQSMQCFLGERSCQTHSLALLASCMPFLISVLKKILIIPGILNVFSDECNLIISVLLIDIDCTLSYVYGKKEYDFCKCHEYWA